jgi:hypothetical protein
MTARADGAWSAHRPDGYHQGSAGVARFIRFFCRRGEIENRIKNWIASRPDVLHERSELHELDGGAHTIEARHALK